MASVYYLYYDALQVKRDIVKKYSDFAENDKRLFFAAVKIQKTWRGYVVRKMIKNWHRAATVIQRWVRGWLVRWHLPEYYDDYFSRMNSKYYNEMATRIQAFWKGFLVRKYVLNVKSLMEERERVEKKNREMADLLRDLFRKNRGGAEDMDAYMEHLAMKETLFSLLNRHHLLRTQQIEGVLSIHGSKELSEIEKILANLSFSGYMNQFQKMFKQQVESGITLTTTSSARRFDLNTNIKRDPYQPMLW